MYRKCGESLVFLGLMYTFLPQKLGCSSLVLMSPGACNMPFLVFLVSGLHIMALFALPNRFFTLNGVFDHEMISLRYAVTLLRIDLGLTRVLLARFSHVPGSRCSCLKVFSCASASVMFEIGMLLQYYLGCEL